MGYIFNSTLNLSELQQRNKIPTVRGWIKDFDIVLKCPFCGQLHHHGLPKETPKEEVDSHLIAHCHRGSYFVRVNGSGK